MADLQTITLRRMLDECFHFDETDSTKDRKPWNTTERLYQDFLCDQPVASVKEPRLSEFPLYEDVFRGSTPLVRPAQLMLSRDETIAALMQTKKRARGQQEASLFALCLEAMGGRSTVADGRQYWMNVRLKRTPRWFAHMC